MLYVTLLLIGVVGVVAMAALGFVDGDGDSDGDDDAADSPLRLLSPLRLFCLALGAGATGLLAVGLAHSPWLRGAIALAGALVFDRLILRPLLKQLTRFASRPAQTLTGAVAQEAIADSRFDATGRGIVRVTVDGQVTRLLATLDTPGAEVSSGDRLLVIAIDPKRNTCRVTPF